MIIVIASILPIILYILVLKLMDSFSLIRWKRLSVCMAYGVLCCLALYFITRATAIPEVDGVSIVPVLEEILKGWVMVVLVRKQKIRFLAETLIYGAAVGGGFALLENIIYLANFPQMELGTAIFRGLGCAFMHMGCTALIAAVALLLKEKPSVLAIPAAFIPSFVLHLLHNRMLLPFSLQLATTVAVFLVLFIFLFNLGEKKVYKWMDRSISTDVATLCSVRAGNFSETNAGKYLLQVREQFQPEVFFDMINFVELSLELKIEKQSRMLLSQAGFEPSEDEKASSEEKVREIAALRKLVGKTGLQVLAPMVQDKI